MVYLKSLKKVNYIISILPLLIATGCATFVQEQNVKYSDASCKERAIYEMLNHDFNSPSISNEYFVIEHGMIIEYNFNPLKQQMSVFTLNGKIFISKIINNNKLFSHIDHFCSYCGDDSTDTDGVADYYEHIPKYILIPGGDWGVYEYNNNLASTEQSSTKYPVRAFCDENGEPIIYNEYEKIYNRDELRQTFLFQFNDHRLSDKIIISYSYQGMSSFIHYDYNEQGNLTKETSHSDQQREYSTHYFYSEGKVYKINSYYTYTPCHENYRITIPSDEIIYIPDSKAIIPIDFVDAHTVFDKSPHAWNSYEGEDAEVDDEETDDTVHPLYNPDKPFDALEVSKNYTNYRLDPEYATLEKDDYPPFEDQSNNPLEHPDYAHPSRPFWMASTEVTQQEFLDLMGFNPSFFPACGNDCPVENVTWFQALEYANRKSIAEGLESCYVLNKCTENSVSCQNVEFKGLDCKGYRLPTDEEWRYMAQRNTNYGDHETTRKPLKDMAYYEAQGLRFVEDDYEPEDDADVYEIDVAEDIAESHGTNWTDLEDIAWTYNNSDIKYDNCRMLDEVSPVTSEYMRCIGPHPVAQKEPDANGLYDFYGNVYEWIWDWHGYAQRSGDSLGPDKGVCRIMRGGSVYTEPKDSAFYIPGCYFPDKGGSVLGFRLVRTLPFEKRR